MILIPGATTAQNKAYNAGRNAYRSGYRDTPPVNMDWHHKHWWLAGFNDVELERKYRREAME